MERNNSAAEVLGSPGMCTSHLPCCPVSTRLAGRESLGREPGSQRGAGLGQVRQSPDPTPTQGLLTPSRWRHRLARHEEGRQLEEEPYGPDSQLPGAEQDLTSQLLSWLKIFTSKYVLICHIFASRQPGSLSSPPGRELCLVREGLPSRN